MLTVNIYSIGKIKSKAQRELEAEYIKRLSAFLNLKLIEIPVAHSASLSPKERRAQEAQKFLAKIKPSQFLIVLDENGIELSSQKFADKISSLRESGTDEISFAIGGTDGWHQSVKDKAGLILSLSRMTFPHQLTRLILIEQLYRAASIILNKPYHRE